MREKDTAVYTFSETKNVLKQIHGELPTNSFEDAKKYCSSKEVRNGSLFCVYSSYELKNVFISSNVTVPSIPDANNIPRFAMPIDRSNCPKDACRCVRSYC